MSWLSEGGGEGIVQWRVWVCSSKFSLWRVRVCGKLGHLVVEEEEEEGAEATGGGGEVVVNFES